MKFFFFFTLNSLSFFFTLNSLSKHSGNNNYLSEKQSDPLKNSQYIYLKLEWHIIY